MGCLGGVEDPACQVVGQVVDKHSHEDGEGQHDEERYYVPLVVLPQDVSYRLQRIENPEEGGIRSPV